MLCIETKLTAEQVKEILNTCMGLISGEIAAKSVEADLTDRLNDLDKLVETNKLLSELYEKRGQIMELLGSLIPVEDVAVTGCVDNELIEDAVLVDEADAVEDTLILDDDGLVYRGLDYSYEKTSVRGFKLRPESNTIKVTTWIGLFRRLILIMHSIDRKRLNKVLEDLKYAESPYAVRCKPVKSQVKDYKNYEKVDGTTVYIRNSKMGVPKIVEALTEVLRSWDSHGTTEQYLDSLRIGIIPKDTVLSASVTQHGITEEPAPDTAPEINSDSENTVPDTEVQETNSDEVNLDNAEEFKGQEAVDNDSPDEPLILGWNAFDDPKTVCKTYSIHESLPKNANVQSISVYSRRLGKSFERRVTNWGNLTYALCRVLAEIEGDNNGLTKLVGKSLGDHVPKSQRYSPSIKPTKDVAPDEKCKYIEDTNTGLSCLINNGMVSAQRNCKRVITAYGLSFEDLKITVESKKTTGLV